MNETIEFKIYDSAEKPQAKAIIENGICVKIKLIISAPKSYYYSLLNDAGLAFEQQYPQYR